MEFTNAGLTRVDVLCSAVLPSDLSQSWTLGRNFTASRWLAKAPGMQFRVLSVGSRGTEVGSMRVFMIGNAQLFEQLTALDDSEHVLRWICVSHPQTISPFLRASFVNYQSSLEFKKITVGNQTFAEWKGHFWTEPQHAAFMHATIEGWYLAGFKGLRASCLKSLSSENLAKQPPHPCGQTAVVGGAEILKDRAAFPVPQQVMHMSHPVRAAQIGYPSPAAAVMDSYLVNDQYFAGTPAQSAGAPSPEDSNDSSGSDKAGMGHATVSSHAVQAARAALGQPAHTGRRHRAHPQVNRSQLASVKEGQKAPSQPPSTLGSSSCIGSSSIATASGSSKTAGSGHRARTNSHSMDRSEAERWRSEAQRQYDSFDLPVQHAREHPAVNKLREQAAKQAALKSDHSSLSAASQLSPDITSSCSNSWDSNKASRDEIAAPAQASEKASASSTSAAQQHLAHAGSCGIPYDTSRNGRREYAIVMDAADAELMDKVSDNLRAQRNRQDDKRRSSFEEEAAALSARHEALHQKRMANAANGAKAAPYASPFAKPTAASPFSQQPAGESSRGAPAGAAEGRQHQEEAPPSGGMCNPFAAAQQGLAGRIG